MVVGSKYRLVADLASCMRKGGTGFYARQGWASGGGVYEWSFEITYGGQDRGEGWQARGRGRKLGGAVGEGGTHVRVDKDEGGG